MPGGAIEDFGGSLRAGVGKPACGQDLAVRQQGGRMLAAWHRHGVGRRPACRGNVVVLFRSEASEPELETPPAARTLPFGSKVAVCWRRGTAMELVAVQLAAETSSYCSVLAS